MNYSDWATLPMGVNEPKYHNIMVDISAMGRNVEKLMGELEGKLNRDEPDYTLLSRTMDSFRQLLNEWSHLVGNIVYSSEDKRGKDSFDNTLNTIEERLDFSESFIQRAGYNRESLVLFYTEMRNILNFIYIFLNDARKLGEGFPDSVLDVMKLKGTLLKERKFVPSPDKELEIETKDKTQIEEETPEKDEGLELFKEISQKVGQNV